MIDPVKGWQWLVGARADQEEAACAVEVPVGRVEVLDDILDPFVHRQRARLVELDGGLLRRLQRLDL